MNIDDVLTLTTPKDSHELDMSILKKDKGLQKIAENYMTKMFREANVFASHAKRATLKTKDIQLARLIRGRRP